MGPKYNHMYPYKREAEGNWKDIQRRRQCEDKAQSEVATSQGMLRDGRQPPEAKRGKQSILSQSLTLILHFWSPQLRE